MQYPDGNDLPAGLGLWLVHQLSLHVTLRRTHDGFTIGLTAGVPNLTS